jgi:DNA-binding PadR family transcriptional regulator
MPEPRRPARHAEGDVGKRSPLRRAIMSLLAIRPMSGYDVRHTYQRALQQIWYAPIGQVYPTLRAMEAEGDLEAELQIQRDRPNRKEYRLSREGEHLLSQWLEEPAALPRMHHEFLHKLFLLDRLGPARQLQFVEDYVKTCERWASQLAAVDEKFSATPHGEYAESAEYQLLALRHLRRLVRCEISSARDILTHLCEKHHESAPPPVRRRTGSPALILTDLNMVARESPGGSDQAAQAAP